MEERRDSTVLAGLNAHAKTKIKNPTNRKTQWSGEVTGRQGSCWAWALLSTPSSTRTTTTRGGDRERPRKPRPKSPELTPIRLPHCLQASRFGRTRAAPAGGLDLGTDRPAFPRAGSGSGGEGWGTGTASMTSSMQVICSSIWAFLSFICGEWSSELKVRIFECFLWLVCGHYVICFLKR